MPDLKKLTNVLERLDKKLEILNSKLDKIITGKQPELKEIHMKILNLLNDWTTTYDLAKILNYRQEYISRKVAELKKMKMVEESRTGKSLFYKRAE